MPGFGVISTTSDTFSPAAAAAVAGGVVIAACFESSPPRNCSDGALWANTTLDKHRTARSVFPITVRLYLENHRAHKSAQGQVFFILAPRLHRFVASYKVLAPPPIAAPTSAPFLPPITPPMPAPAAVDPPTIIAVCFQSRPRGRSSCVLRAAAGVEMRCADGAGWPYAT